MYRGFSRCVASCVVTALVIDGRIGIVNTWGGISASDFPKKNFFSGFRNNEHFQRLPCEEITCGCKSICLHISGSRIGHEEALYLYTSGPDLTSIMPCKYGKPSGTVSKFVTLESLKSDHVRELLMKNKGVDTSALVVSLSLR